MGRPTFSRSISPLTAVNSLHANGGTTHYVGIFGRGVVDHGQRGGIVAQIEQWMNMLRQQISPPPLTVVSVFFLLKSRLHYTES